MRPQAKECWQPPAAGKGKEQISPRAAEILASETDFTLTSETDFKILASRIVKR